MVVEGPVTDLRAPSNFGAARGQPGTDLRLGHQNRCPLCLSIASDTVIAVCQILSDQNFMQFIRFSFNVIHLFLCFIDFL